MSKINRPKLAYSALRINGGYTPAMDRTFCLGNIQDLERIGYNIEDAEQILKATAAMHRRMGRYITTGDLHDLFIAGFECILIKSESAFRHELDREAVDYIFDGQTNMFTAFPGRS